MTLAPGGPVLVLGATGRVGGATLRALQARGDAPVALIRHRSRRDALPASVACRVADLGDPASLDGALSGIGALLLCSGHTPGMLELQLNVIAAAERAGVRRIVKISASSPSLFAGTPCRAAADHMQVERALAASSLDHTSIRPCAFTQLLCQQAPRIAAGTLELTLADAAVSWVDTADVGAVAAAALRSTSALPPCIEVTGPAALDGCELADALATVTGRPVRYAPISDADNRERLERAGAPAWLVEHVEAIFSVLRERGADRVTDEVKRWTGRPPSTVAQALGREPERSMFTIATTDREPTRGGSIR